MANNTNNDEARRTDAARAMESDEQRARRAEREKAEQARRAEAMRAMEGTERRQRREGREEQARQAAAEAAAASAAAEARRQAAARAEEEARDSVARAAQFKADKIAGIAQTEKVVGEMAQSNLNLDPIRTLKSDMAKAVKDDGLSAASIAVAEQAKRQAEPPPAPADKRWGISPGLLIVLILVVAGAGGWWWWQGQATPTTTTTTSTTNNAVLPSESQKQFDLVNFGSPTTLKQALRVEASQPPQPGTITNLLITSGGQTATRAQVEQALGLTLPDSLSRALGPSYMLGIVSPGESKRAHLFLALQTNFYERAFSGMLEWESALGSNLIPPLGIASTSPRATTAFTDKIVRNKDTRILKDATGKTVLLYAFLDKSNIVITDDEEGFVEIFKRFLAKN